jgi:uncharacterized membrane protein YbjE (DUF340 family)
MHIKNIIPMKYVLFILLGAALGAIPGTWFQHYGYDKCYIMLLFMASIGIILKIIEWLYK